VCEYLKLVHRGHQTGIERVRKVSLAFMCLRQTTCYII
jgi:hypothetical protein